MKKFMKISIGNKLHSRISVKLGARIHFHYGASELNSRGWNRVDDRRVSRFYREEFHVIARRILTKSPARFYDNYQRRIEPHSSRSRETWSVASSAREKRRDGQSRRRRRVTWRAWISTPLSLDFERHSPFRADRDRAYGVDCTPRRVILARVFLRSLRRKSGFPLRESVVLLLVRLDHTRPTVSPAGLSGGASRGSLWRWIPATPRWQVSAKTNVISRTRSIHIAWNSWKSLHSKMK